MFAISLSLNDTQCYIWNANKWLLRPKINCTTQPVNITQYSFIDQKMRIYLKVRNEVNVGR